ncbi:hypothetical protein GKZ90_0013820 [Flavobacterium sp. MC2016-06]|uniref:hypothetical protein n=1 Tax=Flavobacterium sp. MC2016-06 TaxID=2676308 RepID=UPI0012BA5D7F|nr:hypothetical protein [Flavobacterium sp. MC2016-06]MBU3861755.1 hypothetical protein [Flavobacterium sp. MC2016-06]
MDLIENSNSFKLTGDKNSIIKTRKWHFSKSKTVKLSVSFRNNPFNIDNSFKVMIIAKNSIVCDTNFDRNGIIANVPEKLLGVKLLPLVVIYKKNKYFVFSSDQTLKTIQKGDNLIHIIFMPTNDSESIYFISTNWRFNEN